MKHLITFLSIAVLSISSYGQEKSIELHLHCVGSIHQVKILIKNSTAYLDTVSAYNEVFNNEFAYKIKVTQALLDLEDYSSRKFKKVEAKLAQTVCFASEILVKVIENDQANQYIFRNATACCPKGLKNLILDLNSLVDSLE